MVRQKNEEGGETTDSCDEKDKLEDKTVTCSHITKAVDPTKLKKVIKSSGIFKNCTECEKNPPIGSEQEDGDDTFEYNNTLWLCLKCGTQLCGRMKQQHALVHYNTPRSDSHSLVIDTATFVVWCYQCDEEVKEDACRKLLDIVSFVKKEVQKPIPESEPISSQAPGSIENKVIAGFKTLTPLLDGSKIEPKKEFPESSTSVFFQITLPPQKKQVQESMDILKASEILPRVRGLSNLGNTCFFNAVVQNMAQTPFLLEVLKEMSEPEKFELPGGKISVNDEDLVMDPIAGELENWSLFTQTLALTLEELQTKSGGVFTPRDLLRQFTNKWPQFSGGDQHDSHEALRHLLESVRTEDLRRYQSVILRHLGYNKKTEPSTVELENKSKVKFYGNQAQDRILRPEPVFRGFLASTLTCQDCFHTSSRHECFLDISLPVTVDKPQPPARRKTSPEPAISQPSGPSKYQLKKEKRMERKAKKAQKHQKRAPSQGSNVPVIVPGLGDSIEDQANKELGETSSVTSSLSESDADVEDNVTDDPQSLRKPTCDANGNNTELKSPQTPEKADDAPENPLKSASDEMPNQQTEANNIVYDGVLSAHGIANLSNQMSKTKLADGAQDVDDEKEKEIKCQQMSRQKQQRQRQISHVDWSNTLAPRYQCPEGELSLQSCLNNFTAVELMTGNNKVGCDGCTERLNGKGGKTVYTNATKQFLVSSPPAVLILHLKRFQVGMRGMFRKIVKHVTFPMILDIAPFCGSKVKTLAHVQRNQKKLLYSLYGIVEHSGGMHGGHYVAYVKVRPKLDKDDARWSFLPKGTKAELDQVDDTKANLDKQVEKVKKRQMSMTMSKDSDDSISELTSTSSSSDEEENAVGGSDEPNEPPPGKWYYVSDSHVREVNEEQVLQAQAYLLFYERIF